MKSLGNYLVAATNCDRAILPNIYQIKTHQVEMFPLAHQNTSIGKVTALSVIAPNGKPSG